MSPYQVVKCPRLMAGRKVEGKGLHAVSCRKVDSSALVTFDFIALQTSGWDKMLLEDGIVGCFG